MRPFPLVLAAALALGAAAPAAAQTVVIVRHAEKVDASADPALSPPGEARAKALAQALAHGRVTHVLTTPLARTRLTGQPAADAAGVAVTPVSLDGGLPAHLARIAQAVRAAPKDATVLVVGHSNTVPEIARALGDPAPQPLTDCDYDRMTVLDVSGEGAPRVLHARFGAPTQAC